MAQESIDLKIKCIISKYKKFDLKNCIPNAWKQSNDDCWIDSALYALFASDIRNIFSIILDEMYKSDNTDIKKTAIYLSNYLEVLNTKSDLTRECKKLYKNLIIHSFSNYLTKINSDYDVLQKVQIRNNNVVKGYSDLILQLFNYMNPTELNFKIEELAGISLNHTIKEYITIEFTEEILIINYASLEPDNTTIGDIQKVHNYKLISYLSGIEGDHIVSTVLCGGSFNYYNNQDKLPVKSIKDYLTLKMMKDADEIILIYVREDLETAAAKPANSP